MGFDAGTDRANGSTQPVLLGDQHGQHLVPAGSQRVEDLALRVSELDFTQNLEEATDAITLGRRHSWLESEGFSLSAANTDVQELPATLYH